MEDTKLLLNSLCENLKKLNAESARVRQQIRLLKDRIYNAESLITGYGETHLVRQNGAVLSTKELYRHFKSKHGNIYNKNCVRDIIVQNFIFDAPEQVRKLNTNERIYGWKGWQIQDN